MSFTEIDYDMGNCKILRSSKPVLDMLLILDIDFEFIGNESNEIPISGEDLFTL